MKVLFFAALKEQLGIEQLDWPHPAATLGELRQQLMAQSPEWQQAFSRYAQMAAVDQSLSPDSTPLAGVQEVAFFPRVTGG